MYSEYPGAPPTAISRQEFLKLSGAGIAGATLLGIMGSSSALAQTSPPLKDEFADAADEYGVPVELLMAMGYSNTRWEMPPVSTGDYEPDNIHGMGGYGIMHLRQDPETDTLSKAAELTGLSEEELKTDRRANVLGGAAVLAAIQGDPKPDTLNGWYDTVAGFGTGPLYANQVYETLEDGASQETSSGEDITLEPQEGAETPQLRTAQAAADYSGATYYGAYSGNYSNASRPSSNPINKIIIHVVQGSWSSAINWFQDSRAGVSAHYTVRSSDGFIGQSVREEDIGYHAGYWSYNQTSIGIEHEGYVSDPSRWFTDAMYRSSARLSAHLCKKYKIPIDRNHIIGHFEVPGCSGPGGGSGCHTDPGSGWNWTKYMDLVRSYAGASTESNVYKQVVDNKTTGRFSASSRWISSTFSSQRYGTDYRVLKTPLSIADNAKFKIKTPARAGYKVWARWPSDSGYNDRTRFLIQTVDGWKAKTVNQRQNGGTWVYLGKYTLAAGDSYRIQVSSKSLGKGYIIADAVLIKRA